MSCFEPSAPVDLNRETAARNDLRDTLRILKRGPKRKSCPEWSAPAELLIMALDPRYYAVRDLIPHGLGYDVNECAKLTQARNTLLKVLVQVRCADGGNGATPYLAHLSRGVTLDKGNKKSGVKALRLIHMFCTWWKAFFGDALRRSLRDPPFIWNDAFHGYITGRRRECAMITQRAVSWRLRKEGIQHLTDFEDMSNAFACTSVNCRAEVLEELINEADRPMFFERILNSTVLYESDEGRFFATPQCGNFMGSSEGPIFFLAAYASPLLQWNYRTLALEEEDLPLLQGVTPSGYACDLGLSAYADDVAKKVVGSSEEGLFEALEFSDKVLDEELEVGGWKRNMDKREVVPTMKGRRPGFDLTKKERGIVAGARHLGGRFTWNGNNREELLCRKRAIRTAWLSMGKFWTVKGHWAKKRIIFGCKVLGAAVSAAETFAWHDSEMKEINSLLCKYMRVMLRGRAKTVEDGRVRQWSNQRLHEHRRIPPFSVEVAVRRIGWLKAMLRDEANHAQALAAVFGRFLGRDVLEKDGGLCEGANPFAVAFHRDVYLFEGVTGTEELYEALQKDGFQSLFVLQSEAWEALQRMDTSLLRAACWTMASGMKLETHVKAQCGEACKVDWCCEILSESGVPCGLRFRSKKSTEMSSVT